MEVGVVVELAKGAARGGTSSGKAGVGDALSRIDIDFDEARRRNAAESSTSKPGSSLFVSAALAPGEVKPAPEPPAPVTPPKTIFGMNGAADISVSKADQPALHAALDRFDRNGAYLKVNPAGQFEVYAPGRPRPILRIIPRVPGRLDDGYAEKLNRLANGRDWD